MVRRGSDENTTDSLQAAADIFVLCFPLLLTDAVRRAHPMASPQFHVVAADGASLAPGLIEDDPRVVVSSAWIDLSGPPILLRLPHTRGRYFSLTVMDTAGEPFASFGARTGDDAGLDLVLAGPNWRGEVRRNLRAKRSTSEACWAVSRIHAHSMLDRPDAIALARRQCVVPLGQETDRCAAADIVLESLPASYLWQVTDVAPDLFFHRLDAILDRAPIAFRRSHGKALATLRAKLGGPSAPSDWSPRFQEALARGLAEGLSAIRAAVDALFVEQGVGWRTLGAADGETEESSLTRAARAYVNLGAPVREDLLTLICDRDQAGKALWGPNVYQIGFRPNALPPTQGYWRLCVRPAPSAARPGLGNRNDLLLGPGGGLDLTLGQSAPDAADIANWLQTPSGEFSLIMRLYAAQPDALDGSWRMPGVQRAESGSGRVQRSRSGGTATGAGPPASTCFQEPFIWKDLA